MGHRFYEATMAKIADQLERERLNTNIEALVAELRRLSAPVRDQPAPPQRADHAANE